MTPRDRCTLLAFAATATLGISSARAEDPPSQPAPEMQTSEEAKAPMTPPPATSMPSAEPMMPAAPPAMEPTAMPAVPPAQMMQPGRMLVATGALTLFASYLPALVVAATSDHRGDKALYVPLVGPWVDLAQRGCMAGERLHCGSTPMETAGLVIMGLSHLAGVVQIVAGLSMPDRPMVVMPATAKAKTTFGIAPAALGRGGYGFAAAGQF